MLGGVTYCRQTKSSREKLVSEERAACFVSNLGPSICLHTKINGITSQT